MSTDGIIGRLLTEDEARERSEELWEVCERLPSDYEPYGERERVSGDCCSCRWFHELAGRNGMDWGVCFNPESPRAGLLTFEHQGCPEYEGLTGPEYTEMDHRAGWSEMVESDRGDG